MKDVIIYCPDTEALKTELRDNHTNQFVEDDLPVSNARGLARGRWLIEKTPTKRNGDETLALVRVADHKIASMLLSLEATKVIKILGTWEELKADSEAKAIYDRVYPRTPVKVTDEDGTEHTIISPEEIGRFA